MSATLASSGAEECALRLLMFAAQTRRRRTWRRSESVRQVANWRDLYGDNLALVEHLLGRPIQSESRHQILLRIIFHYLAADRRILSYFCLADKCGAMLPAYPDDYRASTANALGFPRLGLRLNK